MKRTTKITALLLALTLCLACFSACGNSNDKPSGDFYLGDWSMADDDAGFRILDNVIYFFEDGLDDSDVWGPFSYTVSKDDNYTYLEINVDGAIMVAVALNYDTLVFFDPVDFGDAEYIGVTPNGVVFDATFDMGGDVYFRVDAELGDLPKKLQKSVDALLEYPGETGDGRYRYYKNSCIAYFPESLVDNYYIGVTTDNEYMFLDDATTLTICGLSNYKGQTVKMKGNFIMVE